MVKELKETNVKPQSSYPVQLKIHLDNVTNIIQYTEVAPILRELGGISR